MGNSFISNCDFSSWVRVIVGVMLLSVIGACSDDPPGVPVVETDLTDAAESAYIFGFPIVENFKFFYRVYANDAVLQPNEFLHRKTLTTPSDANAVSPNNDTLYSSAILDLRAEPIVISIPDVTNRYYSVQLLDLFTDNISIISSEQRGATMKDVIVAGPDWDESNFNNTAGLDVVRSNSQIVVAIMRVGVSGLSDLGDGSELQDSTMITALSDFLGEPAPEGAELLAWPRFFDAKNDDSPEFFEYMNFLMPLYDFSEDESSLLEGFSNINVGPGLDFDFNAFSNTEQIQIIDGISAARDAIQFPVPQGTVNGWSQPNPEIGDYDQNYIFRSVVAWYGIYALPLSEAAYIGARVDAVGERLDASAANYRLDLTPQNLLGANYFWSLTMYDQFGALIENPINRYSIGDRTESLEYNEDGSLTLYFQNTSPGESLASNWLPAPNGVFYVTMRLYGPNEEVQAGFYELPAIEINPS
ncbi:MAG: DUF1254 domain-containing protein [Agarilytica sp.]